MAGVLVILLICPHEELTDHVGPNVRQRCAALIIEEEQEQAKRASCEAYLFVVRMLKILLRERQIWATGLLHVNGRAMCTTVLRVLVVQPAWVCAIRDEGLAAGTSALDESLGERSSRGA